MSKVLIYFLSSLLSVNTFAKTDLKNLKSEPDSSDSAKKLENISPQKTKKESARLETNHQEIAKLRDSLKGVNLILNNQPNSPNRIDLMLKKSYLHLSIARELGRNRKSVAQMSEEEGKHLTAAKEVLNRLLQPNTQLTVQKKASVNYLLGLVAFEYEDYKLQQKYFIESLQLDPNSQQSGSLALMIAEQYFDDEDFNSALKYYNNYTKLMSDKQKDLALYKSAWSYISMQKNDKAEDELLKIIQSKKQSGFQKDSLRDLAFIAVRNRSEEMILDYGQKKIQNPIDRNEFWSLCLKYYFQMQTKQPYANLIQVVLKNEKKLLDRLDIRIHQIHDARTHLYSYETINFFQAIRFELEQNKKKIDDSDLESIRKSLKADSEFFIYNLAEAYQNKTTAEKVITGAVPNSSNNLSRAQLAALIEKHILYYDYFFPESKNKLTMYQILLDLCNDAKSLQCVNLMHNKSVSYKKDDKSWIELRQKIRVDQLVLADELYTKDPEKNEELFLKALNDLKNEYPQHELVLKALKKSLAIYQKKNNNEFVLKTYQEIFDKEKNSENLYNLGLTLFKQEKYKAVIELVGTQFPEDQKINQLRVECHLKLADEESNKGSEDLVAYEKHIVEVLKLNRDTNKIKLIYADWIEKSLKLKTNGYPHALQVYLSIPEDIRKGPPLSSYAIKFGRQFLSEANFDQVRKIDLIVDISDKEPDLLNSKHYLYVLQSWTADKFLDPQVVKSFFLLKEDQKNYLLSLISLLNPEISMNYIKQYKKHDQNLQALYLLSLKLKNKKSFFETTLADQKILGPLAKTVIPKVEQEPAFLKEIRKAKFPDSGLSMAKYNALVEKLVPQVKKNRAATLKFFKSSSASEQVKVLPEVEEYERKTAQVIENAPPPEGLDESQKKEYQDGVHEIAKEFLDQADEYKKLYAGLNDKIKQAETEKENDKLPEIDFKKWPWPKNPVTDKSLELQKKSSLEAHLYLDQKFSEKQISESDYYVTRTGLLGSYQNDEMMREYIKSELIQLKKYEVITLWRSLKTGT